jgi:subtilisin-like proprotein convertase family protein
MAVDLVAKTRRFKARKWQREPANTALFSRAPFQLIESLESRILLSGLGGLAAIVTYQQARAAARIQAHHTDIPKPFTPAATSPDGQGFTPAQIRKAYGLDQISFGAAAADGTGQTIAIIDAYNYPTAANDLQKFDAAFGLPDLVPWSASGNSAPYLRIVSQTGGTNLPATDPVGAGNDDWEQEEALDLEWAHAIAPGANIILIEAANNFTNNLITATVGWARTQATVSVISMSFSQTETSSETSSDSLFTTPAGHIGITSFAATGDSGTPSGYPAYSPNVVAVGGTSLTVNDSGNYQSESGWSSSGGGISTVEGKPSYQNTVVTQTASNRANPDVSWLADPSTGVPVYDSYDFGTTDSWREFGGTSLATPMWAGLMAIIDQGRVASGLTTLDGKTGTLPKLYALPASDFHDITTGNNGFAAGVGYDLVTGRGTPIANLLVNALIAPPTAAPTALDLLDISDTGVSSTDNITALNNSSPSKTLQFSVSGTLPGATVNLYSDGQFIGTAVASDTTTLITTNGTFALTSGSHAITATQTQVGLSQSAATPALTINVDTTPPSVTAQVPAGTTSTALSDFKFTFNEPIDISTFDLSDITSFTGPSSTDILSQITGFAWSVGNTVLDIQFSSQSAVGTYQIVLGPQVLDLAGNPMAAPYTGNFTLVSAIYSASMDTDPGWTFDNSTWAWGQPTGGGSHNLDPTSGHSGSNVIGYNLAGDYERGLASTFYATTPSIDMTNYQSITLSFYRWLGVRNTATATIQASPDGGATWVTLWTNNSTTISDSAWSLQSFTLPASFNGQPSVKFRWGMGPTSSSFTTYPGWNIDDVLVTGAPFVPPSVSGTVFLDANANGSLDATESGIPGATVFLDSNNNGILDPATTSTFTSTNIPLAIPDDNTTGVTSSLVVAGTPGSITQVTISFDITHTFDADLSAFLIAPDNTQITLFSKVGSSGDNFTATTLSDSATSSITTGTAPFTGTFKPSPGLLSAFLNKSANGTWKLKVEDTGPQDTGTLIDWSLNISTSAEVSTTTDSAGKYAFNVPAGTYTVQEILPPTYIAINGAFHTIPVNAVVSGQDFALFPTTFADSGNNASYYLTTDNTGTTLQIFNSTAPLAIPAYQVPLALLPSLTFNLNGSNQSFTLDFSNGSPIPANFILNSVHGSNNSLTLIGHDSLQSFTMTDTQIGLTSAPLLTFNNLDNLTLTNASINFTGNMNTFSQLTVGTNCIFYWN